MKPILHFLLLGWASCAIAQETGKPVDFDNPKVGDYIRVEGYLQDLCTGQLRPDLAYVEWMKTVFPDFPEIVELRYIHIPNLNRPWMLILQPIKENE